MAAIGRLSTVRVTRVSSPGVYVDASPLGEVLIPHKHCNTELHEGDDIEAFIYLDGQGRLIATQQQPLAQVGEFAYLRAVSNSDYGTFLDWGLDKDLFVPFAEQHRPMQAGKSYLVYVHINQLDGRIMASSRVDRFLQDESDDQFVAGQEVKLIVANSTDLGFKVIVDHSHSGVLYKNEVAQRLSFGQSLVGFVRRVREDGRLDISLHGGRKAQGNYDQQVLQYLHEQDGFISLHDKSDPADIERILGMSKKSFKRAISALYKARQIRIEDDGIHAVE